MAKRTVEVRAEMLDVEVQPDHLERLAKCRPSSALAELVWNALDADATKVSVRFLRNGLTGIDAIEVADNGSGIGGEGEDPNDLFRRLGGSWKRHRGRTTKGRAMHGQAGEGRFKAFALGESVRWTTRYRSGTVVSTFSITKDRSSRQFMRSPTAPAKSPTGTLVRIENPKASPAPDASTVFTALCQEFALYLREYPGIEIEFDDRPIDPAALIARVDDVGFDVELSSGQQTHCSMTIVEWAMPAERALYLCDEDGFALADVPPGIHAPGFNFTAHVKGSYLRTLKEQNLIDSDLAPGRERVIAAAKDSLRDHFRKRAAELARDAVDRWRSEEIYPYGSVASNPVETVERQVFDIVAVNLSEYLPDFEKSDPKQKRLTFRLLKQALEENPESLQTIFGEVLGLPKEQQDDLADLLKQTSLSAIINASKVVADRVNFLTGLENLIFDPETKQRLKERQQLHRMLAPNSWLFGEEYNLTVDDEGLEAVLKKHLALLGRTPEDTSPVLREDGTQAVVDLMLSRAIPQPNPAAREHLVVELKRPSQKIDDKVLAQITSYAFAVAGDERFRDTGTKWRFIAVSNDMSESVRRQANQRNRPANLVYDDDTQLITIWVLPWSQLLQGARGRLEFFRKELNYSATRDSAHSHLLKVYSKYLPAHER